VAERRCYRGSPQCSPKMPSLMAGFAASCAFDGDALRSPTAVDVDHLERFFCSTRRFRGSCVRNFPSASRWERELSSGHVVVSEGRRSPRPSDLIAHSSARSRRRGNPRITSCRKVLEPPGPPRPPRLRQLAHTAQAPHCSRPSGCITIDRPSTRPLLHGAQRLARIALICIS